jgi:hypothetical protein
MQHPNIANPSQTRTSNKANNNLVKKHQKAQLQAQDRNPAKSNQTTINNMQRRKKQASTTPPGMTQFQSQLQKPKRANCNNTNRQARTTTTCKQEISGDAKNKHEPVNHQCR